MAYQSLYRRYRPQTFAQIRGQRHVVAALRNAVVKGEVGHAYLLHGPRGTGKTTSARVLAKALNCEDLGAEGEPCAVCDSCVSIEHGRSFDLHELDAAGNNKVEDMRALLAKVNLGTPGRAKVYVLDEVHMLTSQSENALLKTLEEPPDHVVWVLATTEPHKVVETIRSRCQVFELSLLRADEMADHVRWVIADAGLDVGPEIVEHVVVEGGGSVRDTLSALDRVVAAGGVTELDTSTDALLDAIACHDVAATLTAVDDATGRGRDPRTIGESVLFGLREAFLVAMKAPPRRLAPSARSRADRIAAVMKPSALTRALEMLGVALVEMRQAPDPRVDLEVTLVRLCRSDADHSLEELTRRVEQLETQISQMTPEMTGRKAGLSKPGMAARTRSPSTDREDAATEAPPAAKRSGVGSVARQTLASKRAESSRSQRVNRNVTQAAPPDPLPVTKSAPPSTGQPIGDVNLRTLKPTSPTDVVQLAQTHFGLARQDVIRRAQEVLGPAQGTRTAEECSRVWEMIIEDHLGSSSSSSATDLAELAPGSDSDDAADTGAVASVVGSDRMATASVPAADTGAVASVVGSDRMATASVPAADSGAAASVVGSDAKIKAVTGPAPTLDGSGAENVAAVDGSNPEIAPDPAPADPKVDEAFQGSLIDLLLQKFPGSELHTSKDLAR